MKKTEYVSFYTVHVNFKFQLSVYQLTYNIFILQDAQGMVHTFVLYEGILPLETISFLNTVWKVMILQTLEVEDFHYHYTII